MRRFPVALLIVFVAAGLILSGCGKAREQAEEALKVAEKAVSEVKTEAEKFVPDKMKALESALTAAKDKLGKKDYKAALTEATAIPAKAKEVADAIKAKKDELAKVWTDLSQGVPKMVEAIKSRVDILSQSKKLPEGITQQKFDEVKSGLGAVLQDWGQAEESYKAGNLSEAIAKANSVKEKAAQCLQLLGMPVPEAATS
jgi:uncharacterized protein YoxC